MRLQQAEPVLEAQQLPAKDIYQKPAVARAFGCVNKRSKRFLVVFFKSSGPKLARNLHAKWDCYFLLIVV